VGRKGKFSVLEKLAAVEDYLLGQRSTSQICREMPIHERSFYSWLQKYQMFGAGGLTTVRKNKYYPETIKLQAVRDYLGGSASQDEICRKYEISVHSILHQWIKKYNGHEIFKSHNSQGEKCMTKGRRTSYEERVEIVAFCIANNDNYQTTADKFQVSYQQVYTWMRKYKSQGSESLADHRGKQKIPVEINESEKLAAQLKLLEAENGRLKMENDFLKKLDEVERRRTVGHVRNTDILP
jgi:transposase